MRTDEMLKVEDLRAEIERLQRAVDWYTSGIAERDVEIERLRQRIAELEDPHYLKGREAEIERLRALAKEASDAIEKLALEMPPPNEYTPRLVMMAQTMRRRALEPKP